MKKIGIVGGLGPESTLEYYRGIIEAFKPTYDTLGFPEIAVESVDLRSFTEKAQREEWEQIAAMLIDRFETLRRGGAQFGVIASNTPHRVFDSVQRGTALSLLSIVSATRDRALELGIEKLCLLGTGFTMRSEFFQRVLGEADIEVIVPDSDAIDYIQGKIFSEVAFGIIRDDTRREFLRIVERIDAQRKIQGVILGCTELPLLLKPEHFTVHYLDTTAIHIAAIVDACRGEQGRV
jgi:aspartate racemase